MEMTHSDAIDMIRGGGDLDRNYNAPLDSGLIDRLLRVPLDGQHDLVLSDLTAMKKGAPAVLHLGARVRLVGHSRH